MGKHSKHEHRNKSKKEKEKEKEKRRKSSTKPATILEDSWERWLASTRPKSPSPAPPTPEPLGPLAESDGEAEIEPEAEQDDTSGEQASGNESDELSVALEAQPQHPAAAVEAAGESDSEFSSSNGDIDELEVFGQRNLRGRSVLCR